MPVRFSRNAYDQLRGQVKGPNRMLSQRRATIHPTRGPVLQDQFPPPGQTTGALGLFRVQANAFFQPGQPPPSTFRRWDWTGSGWSDSGVDLSCIDPNKEACFAQNEFGWAWQIDSGNYGLLAQGTYREAQTSQAIDVNASGGAFLVTHTAANCTGTERTSPPHAITVCNGTTGDATTGIRKLFDNERIFVRWLEDRWICVSVPRIRVFGKPQTDLQANSNGTFNVWQLLANGTLQQWGTNTAIARNISGEEMKATTLYQLEWYAGSELAIAMPREAEPC